MINNLANRDFDHHLVDGIEIFSQLSPDLWRPWLTELFGFTSEHCNSYRPSQFESTRTTKLPILLIAFPNQEHCLVSYCERHKIYYGLVILGDERLEDFMGYIISDKCIFVAREYWHPFVSHLARASGNSDKLISIGLGWHGASRSHPFEDSLFDRERYVWNFIGARKDTRSAALKEFCLLDRGFLHLANDGLEPEEHRLNGLNDNSYWNILQQSIFTLSPSGWMHLETFRLYEAMEAGSIPVTLINAMPTNSDFNYWSNIFKTNRPLPFVLAMSWKDARIQCQNLLDTGEYSKDRQLVTEFWVDVKQKWKKQISHALKRLALYH